MQKWYIPERRLHGTPTSIIDSIKERPQNSKALAEAFSRSNFNIPISIENELQGFWVVDRVGRAIADLDDYMPPNKEAWSYVWNHTKKRLDALCLEYWRFDRDGNAVLVPGVGCPLECNGYLFYDDESATLYSTPLLEGISSDVEELTDEQVRQVFLNAMLKDSKYDFTESDVATWSREKVAQAMWDVHSLILDSVALVPGSMRDEVEVVGDSIAEGFGDDSSTYRACAQFATYLKATAVKVIPFPTFDGEKWYGDME